MKKKIAGLVALMTLSAAPANAVVGPMPVRSTGAIYYASGGHEHSPNAGQARPALSLSKLYLGYYVLRYGAPSDKARVYDMIRLSHDGIATQLDARYPQAIDRVASDYRLTATARRGYWGNSVTSANDVARFVSAIRFDPVAAPLIQGMVNAAPIAADGYPQNFGTSRLPGAQGTKFGWGDARNIHATVTLGNGWVAAEMTNGGVGAINADAAAIRPNTPVIPGVPAAPAIPVLPQGSSLPQLPELPQLPPLPQIPQSS